jgi:LCP family protein required for cell wall assembly
MKTPVSKKKKWIIALTVLLLLLLTAGVYAGSRLGFFGLEDKWQNFLLIGTDTRKDEANAGRSDTMIICSVNLAKNKVKLTSLARDMYVDYPGDHYEGKLNAAIRWGGPELLMETINTYFDMDLEKYISINFYGLIDIVDALGGVDVEISAKEASTINRYVAEQFKNAEVTRVGEGNAHLCGVQALTFSRIRSLDSDYNRTGRQRRVLAAMLQKVKGSSPKELYSLASTCLEHTATNMTLDELIGLAGPLLRRGLDSFEDRSLPSPGNYRNGNHNGESVVKFDAQQVTEELHQFIYGE